MTGSYTQSSTETETLTNTQARFLASRIASDLTLVRIFHGHHSATLTEQHVIDLAFEAAALLRHGLLDSIKYGFQIGNEWVFALHYKVNQYNQVEPTSDDPGSIIAASLPAGSNWLSSLTPRQNPAYSDEQAAAIREKLPVQRYTAEEPGGTLGTWITDKSYGAGNVLVERAQFRMS